MMKHTQTHRVYYSDTDCYGVVWHGSCLRWFEAARVEYSEKLGLKLEQLRTDGISLPVVEMNLRYKRAAFVDDVLELDTMVTEVTKTKIVFVQELKKQKTGKTLITASVTIVAVDANGRIIAPLPSVLSEAFEQA